MAAEAAAAVPIGEGLVEAQRLSWRERVSDATLRRDGRRWSLWTRAAARRMHAAAAH